MMNRTNFEGVARFITRKMRMIRWLLVIVFLLSLFQPSNVARAQLTQLTFEDVTLFLPDTSVTNQRMGSVYTELQCLAKPDERIIIGPAGTPAQLRGIVGEVFDYFRSPDAPMDAATYFGRSPDSDFGIESTPTFFPVDSYELTFPNYREITRTTGELSAFLYRDPNIDVLDTIIENLYPVEAPAEDEEARDTYATLTSNYYIFNIEGAGSGGQSPSGNPFSGPVEADVATYTDFQNQWAITNTKATTMYTDHDQAEGDGVVVAVFDTSPFRYVNRPMPFAEPEPLHESLPITIMNHYTEVSTPTMDHGVFVAGLVKEIAPKADLHLYRSFNDSGSVDVYEMVNLINLFAKEFLSPTAPQREGYVVNMSFSFYCPFGPDFDYDEFEDRVDAVNDAIDSLVANPKVRVVASAGNIPNNNMTVESIVTSIVTSTVNSTITPIMTPTITSIVTSVVSSIVTSTVTSPVTPTLNSVTANGLPRQQFPASHPDVIGVGALDRDGGYSCFTNDADVFAPGGGTLRATATSTRTNYSCFQSYDYCAEETECPEALMSFSTESESGFAYWNGSSFSAPLVSGLLALMLSDTASMTPTLPITDVIDIIDADAFGRP